MAVVVALIFGAAGGCALFDDEPEPSTGLSDTSGAESAPDPSPPDANTAATERLGRTGRAEIDDQVRYADVNGDALADMILRKADNTIWVSLADSSGFGALGRWAAPGGPLRADQVFLVDVDGDGRTDLVFRDASNRIAVHLSTGAAFAPPTGWLTLGGEYFVGQVTFADIDANGMADLIFREIVEDCATTKVGGDMCPAGWDQIGTSCRTWLSHCGRNEQCETLACSVHCEACDAIESLKVGISTGSTFQALVDWETGFDTGEEPRGVDPGMADQRP